MIARKLFVEKGYDQISINDILKIIEIAKGTFYYYFTSKAERKGRTKAEVDEIIRWFTGYTQDALEKQIIEQVDYEHFLKEAPHLNPSRNLIKGVVCGIRVEEIEDPMMREVRYLDKLIDELAKGKAMNKILRANSHL